MELDKHLVVTYVLKNNIAALVVQIDTVPGGSLPHGAIL
jgi:hypothetical protein